MNHLLHTWHASPVKPSLHLHMNLLNASTHMPSFMQSNSHPVERSLPVELAIGAIGASGKDDFFEYLKLIYEFTFFLKRPYIVFIAASNIIFAHGPPGIPIKWLRNIWRCWIIITITLIMITEIFDHMNVTELIPGAFP